MERGHTTYFGGAGVSALDNPKWTDRGTPTHICDAYYAYQSAGTSLIAIGCEDYGRIL